MAIGITPSIKPFANLANQTGVPLAELQALLGEASSQIVSSISVTGANSLTTAQQLTGQAIDTTTHDYIQIQMFQAGSSTVIDAWQISISDWQELTAAAVGDTIVDGTTAITVDGALGKALFGRLASPSSLLIQIRGTDWRGGVAPSGALLIRALAGSYSGGLINRRLTTLYDQQTHRLFLHTRSQAKPAAPTDITYDGVNIGTPVDGSYVPLSSPLVGIAAEWIATADATYSRDTNSWSIGDWVVVAGGSTFHAQYSQNGQGGWLERAAPEWGQNYYVRWRQQDSTWSQPHRVGGNTDLLQWNQIVSTTWQNSISAEIITQSLNLSTFRFLSASYQQGSDDWRGIVIPSDVLETTTRTSDGHSRSIVASLAEDGSSWTRGDRAISGADADRQLLRINFAATTAGHSSAAQIRLSTGYNSGERRIVLRTV